MRKSVSSKKQRRLLTIERNYNDDEENVQQQLST